MAFSSYKKNKENNLSSPDSVTAKIPGAESDSMKPFVKKNFIFMGVSMLLIIVGFLLMTGSANDNPAHFNADIFSTRRIVVGPALAFIGFVAMAFSIVYSPKAHKDSENVVESETEVRKED